MPWIHRERQQSSFKDPQVTTHGPQNHGKYENMMATLFDVVSGSVNTTADGTASGSPYASGSSGDIFEPAHPFAPDNYVTASVMTAGSRYSP